MREYKIAAIPGDGIGVEVIAAGLKVLEALAQRERGFRLQVEHFPWDEIFYEVARDYPEVATQRVLVDAMTTLTARPSTSPARVWPTRLRPSGPRR
jgi:isocitrate/isopropylmalate dehydrogenase